MRPALADVAAFVLAAPLVASVLLNLWADLWEPRRVRAVGRRVHAALLAVESGAAGWLLSAAAPRAAFVAAGVLYAALALGAGALRLRRGAVPCGCWGSLRSSLSWPLVAANGTLAAIAGGFAFADRRLGVAESTAAGAVLVAAAIAGLLLAPEAWRLHRGVKPIAARYRDRVLGFPEPRVR